MVTIGLDPHPDSHTIAALDGNGTILAVLTVANDAGGLALLYRFALPFPERRWAIEGAANRYTLPFVSELLERLNRTWKYSWLFRHECITSLEVQALADRFQAWYNRKRRHSTLAYQTPWSVLAQPAEVELAPT